MTTNWIMSNEEISERIDSAISKLGFETVRISILSNEVNHDRMSPVTAIVLLKQKSDAYSVHYFFSYGETDKENECFDQGCYDLDKQSALIEFTRRVEKERKYFS